jgi:hypothetical protein
VPVRSTEKTRKKITGTIRANRERASGQDESRARTRPRDLTPSTQTNLKASTTTQHHVHAHPAVGITSTEPGRKASPCKPGGRARPRKNLRLRLRLRRITLRKHRPAYEPLRPWFAIIADPKRIVPEIPAAQSIARCAKLPAIDRNLAHARSASVANARQSDIWHANVDHSWYALTVALKRIERITLAAQSTARCVKHPVIDRSSARASSVSAASANKSDTRLENAESKATAPLGVMSMGEIRWIMLTMKMPTPARRASMAKAMIATI